jgi:chromosome segregation ATPase
MKVSPTEKQILKKVIKYRANFKELCHLRENLDENEILEHNEHLREAAAELELEIEDANETYEKLTKQMEELEGRRQQCNALKQTLQENLCMCNYFLRGTIEKNAPKKTLKEINI